MGRPWAGRGPEGARPLPRGRPSTTPKRARNTRRAIVKAGPVKIAPQRPEVALRRKSFNARRFPDPEDKLCAALAKKHCDK